MMNMNCPTSTGSPNFIKHLTNKDTLLVPKMFHKTSANTSYKILTAVKERLQMYCATVYARSGLIKCGFSKIQKNYYKA
jgi:hypothetical protein